MYYHLTLIVSLIRAASLVANKLECKAWLRKEEGALCNKFQAFQAIWDSDSESDSDCEDQ